MFAKKDATKHLRYKFGEDVRTENPQHSVVIDDMLAWGLPAAGLGVRATLVCVAEEIERSHHGLIDQAVRLRPRRRLASLRR